MKRIGWLWHLALASFVLAALTGFLYRLGMIDWLPEWGLSLGNIRHAHSHLMFFGWAVPLPFLIMRNSMLRGRGVSQRGASRMKSAVGSTLLFGLASYPFFLAYGYRPVAIGATSLPLSVILSGFVMLCWYAFIRGYWQARPALRDKTSRTWFDGALTMLLISSLGAWSVAVVQAVDPANHLLMKGLTHFFLATFTEGWVVLALLSLFILKLPVEPDDWPVSQNFSLGCIAIGAPLTFPYGISETLLSPSLLLTARLGGAVSAIGLLQALYAIGSSGRWKSSIWIWPLALVGLKALMQLTASVLPSSFLFSDHGLRIFYLHVLLLGAFTLAIMAWWHRSVNIPDSFFNGIVWSIVIVLGSLLLPTPLWPTMWTGSWIFYLLAAAALLPALAITVYWIKMIQSQNNIQ
ncbi:hypothetical protein SAMN05443144_107163 [Fodinibius roseus]|uniref:Cytochrome oxidase subunit I profile domain-containing protein n=1 Tax=Fodinibius roseus TaxID=1194090 RepID=A0A1M5ATM1_9BACT|nr:hypothetical protein [Fodinibius roseus]SHF33302.1 hypothetical protein SAMN05443144_107163 [Fodinibius roseus]